MFQILFIIDVTSIAPFTAGINGVWLGQKDFAYENSAYYLTLNNFFVENNYKTYANMMKHFQKDLEKYTTLGNAQVAPYQALLWTSFYSNYTVNGYEQIFRLAGDPSTIYLPSESYGSIATPHGACILGSITTFVLPKLLTSLIKLKFKKCFR